MPALPFISRLAGPFVKICGLTSRADAEVCREAGADAIGINFFPGSKRYQPLVRAGEWLAGFSGEGFPARVALFVNAGFEEIRAAVETGFFEAVQLHGDETPEFCASVKSLGHPVIRALALRTEDDLAQIEGHPADAFILDACAPPGIFGGTGHLCDWSLAAVAVLRFPDLFIFLSGGLNPENVASALTEVTPAGVDVASGVESAPGVKDHAKIRAFVAAVKAGNRQYPTIPIDN